MTDSNNLDKRSENLASIADKLDEPLVGVRLDILRNIMDDLDASPKLKEIFGDPVCSKLGIVPNINDIMIAEFHLVELSDEQRQVFQAELSAIMQARIKEAQGI
ncbi:MAG: hypothetical protein ABH834_02125 [Candidatus Altiarchaeota archaeon]